MVDLKSDRKIAVESITSDGRWRSTFLMERFPDEACEGGERILIQEAIRQHCSPALYRRKVAVVWGVVLVAWFFTSLFLFSTFASSWIVGGIFWGCLGAIFHRTTWLSSRNLPDRAVHHIEIENGRVALDYHFLSGKPLEKCRWFYGRICQTEWAHWGIYFQKCFVLVCPTEEKDHHIACGFTRESYAAWEEVLPLLPIVQDDVRGSKNSSLIYDIREFVLIGLGAVSGLLITYNMIDFLQPKIAANPRLAFLWGAPGAWLALMSFIFMPMFFGCLGSIFGGRRFVYRRAKLFEFLVRVAVVTIGFSFMGVMGGVLTVVTGAGLLAVVCGVCLVGYGLLCGISQLLLGLPPQQTLEGKPRR